MGIGTECKKGNSEKRADMVLWDGMGWDDDDWKVWGVGAERKACACLKWWHEVKGTVLKVGGYPDTSTPYGAKLVKAKGFSIYFGLSLWVWVWVYWVVPYNPSTKKIYLLLNAFAFIGQCQHHDTSLSLSLSPHIAYWCEFINIIIEHDLTILSFFPIPHCSSLALHTFQY